MTEPLDLDAVQERYNIFARGWIGYAAATACAKDVPALIAEIQRLHDLVPQVYGEEIITGPDINGLIDIKGRRGSERWTLTCPEHGKLGEWPVVPYTDKTEPELAWDKHVAEQHGDGGGQP